ncbi:MAG: hypothetical protein ABFS86_14775 [Planctomycetota bacterium]
MRTGTALLTTVVFLLLAALPAAAEELTNAAEVTERNRPLDRILDLTVQPRDGPGGRHLVVVIDPTASLVKAGFAPAFRAALMRHRERLVGTAISIHDMDGIRLAPTFDLDRVGHVVAEVTEKPLTTIQNVYAALRRAGGLLAERPGKREILLVTLENGDAEDDLNRTVSLLVKSGVKVNVIGREAYLSDTYWLRRPEEWHPELMMHGGESAFPELPWSFRLQLGIANEAVSSGFGIFGLTRTVAATGGKIYLYYPASARISRCGPLYSTCHVCLNQHLDCGEIYQMHVLRALAPMVGPRADVGRHAATDPYFQAAISAWSAAANKGVMEFKPTIGFTGDGLRARGVDEGKRFVLGDTAAYDAQAARAEKAAAACGAILSALGKAIHRADASGGEARYRAMAGYIRVMLEVTRFNCLHFSAFCREVAPVQEREAAREPKPPEIPVLRPDFLYYRIAWRNLSLCHGVGPLVEYRFPGGDRLSREMARLDRVFSEYVQRYRYSPFAQAVRRQCLATYYVVGKQQAGIPPPRWAPKGGGGTTSPGPGPQRPARGAPSGGGTGGGATTGGD